MKKGEQNRTNELPLSMLDLPAKDDGIAGAKLGIEDDNTTGKFLNQTFKLDVLQGDVDELIKGATEKVAAGDSLIIADLEPDALLKFANAFAGKPVLIFNVGSPDERLREEDCRANVLHIAPSRAMLADALAQYLVWKKWPNWFLVYGPRPEDKLLADSYRHAAKKFGAKIVEEREFKQPTGSRRADGGFEQVQQQIPTFMQGAKDHDVVIVADAGNLFADYFPYRTWIPRPVAGSAELVASSWHPALELWGGTQFQHRFKRLNSRNMRPIDYDAWVATRVVGEAATRKQTADIKELSAFIRSPGFEVAAFKGVATSFRWWNGSASPTDHRLDAETLGQCLAAAGFPASDQRARHAGNRQTGNQVQSLYTRSPRPCDPAPSEIFHSGDSGMPRLSLFLSAFLPAAAVARFKTMQNARQSIVQCLVRSSYDCKLLFVKENVCRILRNHCKTSQLARCADYSMTRPDNGDRVFAIGSTYRAHRFGTSYLLCKSAMTACLTEGYGEHRLPNLLLKRCSYVIQNDGK